MKIIMRNLLAAMLLVAASLQTHAQSTLVYDQQSATGPNSPPADDFFRIQEDSPLLQSFVPSLSAIGFVQFEFWDIANNGTNGATVYVNLWTGSPNINSATLLGSTALVYMPNGFVNSGLGFAGITNFYFTTPIALLSGQTYYLQPVVLSGDDPWDIAVLGNGGTPHDYYPAGDLFERGTDIGIDSWFREGVVPEPSTLALVGLSSLLFFIFKRRFKPLVLLLFAIPLLSAHSAPDSVVQVTADAAGLSRISGATLPRMGTFWVMKTSSDGNLIVPPYPFLPPGLSSQPIYSVTNNIFIVDDTGGQLMPSSAGRLSTAQAASTMQAQATKIAALIERIQNPPADEEFHPDFFPLSPGTNDLWLSIEGVTNGISYLTIHIPADIDINTTNFNLFYTTNLLTPFTNWWWLLTTVVGQTNLVVPNATDPQGFYALGLASTNGRPPVNGDDLPPICPNTSISFTLTPSTYASYTILTHPTNGVLTGTAPTNLTYTPNPCFEGGQDSFTYKANDGTNDSAPATVTITVNADAVYAYSPSFEVQACRGGSSQTFSLGSDSCGETLSYGLLSGPAHGTLSGTAANLTYSATGTNFTGTDSFTYVLYNCAGDASTNTINITVGDRSVSPTSQTLITGTNQPLTVNLSFVDYDNCNADTNYYLYTIISGPTNGTLTNIPPNLKYIPNTNYEGPDSFQFTVSDGTWSNAATVTIYVVGGLFLTNVVPCNPFRTELQLDWSFDAAVSNMVYQDGMDIGGFNIYRSTNSGSSYTPIATNQNPMQLYYLDYTAAPGQTNDYVVTFQAYTLPTYALVESPRSNKVQAWGTNPNDLIPPDAIWSVVTNLANPSSVTNLQAPFSSSGTNQYPGVYPLPLPHTLWPGSTTWSNHITLFIPTNSMPLAQVSYSIAIDNNYKLYLNNSNAPIDETVDHMGDANWAPFKSFNSVAAGLLHYGTNDIGVWIEDGDPPNYFSMVVTTNTCGQ